MTKRSERERAEQEVIDAALQRYAVLADMRSTATEHADAQRRLHNACVAYEKMGLAQLSDRGATSNNAPDTSGQAAASLDNVSGLARTCFDEIVLAGGLTTYQLTQVLGREHQTISARVNDLMKKGWIVDSGQRRKTGSGRNAIVWKPSHLALQEMT